MLFTKMHGLGNDFIIVEDLERAYPNDEGPVLARRICDRRIGIGADVLMFIQRGEKAPLRMFLYNSDGSIAEMCGNGLRCFARYAYDRGLVSSTHFSVETEAGIKEVELELLVGKVSAVKVDMGAPLFCRKEIPMLGVEENCQLEAIEVLNRRFICSAVNTGVPHLAVFLENPMDEADILRYGQVLETHPLFPKKINVNFIEVTGPDTVQVRTWERGCGRTLACGTDSCASAVCAAKAGYTGRNVRVKLAMGELNICWASDDEIFMTGPAEYCCQGEF